MNSIGEIPAGCNRLKHLLYPFHGSYPLKLWSKYRWWKNDNFKRKLFFLNKQKNWLTIVDRLGAPGDALITANVIRCLKKVFPKLRINCITPHPDLIRLDPHIDTINQPETFYSFDSSYWELIVRKEKGENIVKHSLSKLGIRNYEYKSIFYLSEEEKKWAQSKRDELPPNKPILAICTKSKEPVKNWPTEYWLDLISGLLSNYFIIQLGDKNEPKLEGVTRYAGELNMRESAAILSQAVHFIGPDSLLMHMANGLDIPSTIIFGGSRPVGCFGYEQNNNLINTPECSPCWIHEGYETCGHNIKCMDKINQAQVLEGVELLSRLKTNPNN
jgi:ADP-heptose:LPS heptosyltransferase